ncbi:MAG: hypothetical exported protein [Marine Group I thaumarchaeote]|nr:MAG: hypothetical exported protein [Marine Group I thaumarchaeote]
MNKILLTGIVSALFLVCSSFSLSIFAQETLSPGTMDHVTEMGGSLELWVTLAHWTTGVATVVLAVALIRTFHHMQAVTNMTTMETEYRLRPWIGPINGINKMDHSINEKCQFDIAIKNFGELPASRVTAKFKVDTKMLNREDAESSDLESFDLGPMLPNMEKHYWFFIEPELWKKALEGQEKLFTILYFEYKTGAAKSGYGMISEYVPSSQNFVHRDMWIDDVKLASKS